MSTRLRRFEQIRSQLRRRRGREDEGGWTAIEIVVTLLVLAVLFTVTMPTITIFMNLSNQVNATYSGGDQMLLVTGVLSRYFRAAVEPAPETRASGFAPFITATANQITFTANFGNSNGPGEVNAQLTGTAPNAVLTITVANANPNTCPTTNNPNGTCTWGTARNIATLQYVTTANPFSYIPIVAPTCGPNSETTPLNLQNNPMAPWPPSSTVTYPCGGTDTTANPWTSTPSTTTWSWITSPLTPLDQVWGLQVNLQTQPPGARPTSMNTSVFLASTSSYLYSARVG